MKTEHGLQTTGPRDHAPAATARQRGESRFTFHASRYPRHSRRGFTLIELLIVIAIMAVLAALTFPILGAVKRNMIRTRARGGLTAVETALEAYKVKFGQYPPDNPVARPWGTDYSVNQLFYELMGTTNIPLPAPHFQTLDGSAQMPATDVPVIFLGGISGFVNCSQPGNGDDAPTGITFLKDLKANQFLAASVNNKPCTVLGLTLDGPTDFMQWDANMQKNINPWHYNSSNPRYNTKSFDLWIDVMVGGKTNRICNWSDQPQVVSTPY